jgi:hemolysin-activating ACP:hemolysin acyltransferase
VHLADQMLPVGNAFTDQSAYIIPSGVRNITFYVTYTRGDSDGHPVLRLLWGNGIEEIQSTLLNETFTQTSSATSSQELFVNDLIGPTPVNDNPISFLLETTPPGGSKTVRLLAAEGGTGNSGNISITITASS